MNGSEKQLFLQLIRMPLGPLFPQDYLSWSPKCTQNKKDGQTSIPAFIAFSPFNHAYPAEAL